MAKVKVFNVGQGDSILLEPEEGCDFCGEVFLIDVGPGNLDITKQIDKNKKIHLILTHSHTDHINGLKFFWKDSFSQIEEIIVPFCQNEIMLIAKAILNLRGMNMAVDCNEFIHDLEEMINGQIFLKQISRQIGGPSITYAYEGQDYCAHLECLNPPVDMEINNWIDEMEEEDISQVLENLFEENFAEHLKRYMSSSNKYAYLESPYFMDITLRGKEDRILQEYEYNRTNFVLDFIMSNYKIMQEFNENPTRGRLRKVHCQFQGKVHDTCIVLRAEYENTFLFTGDASKRVFKRLMKKGKDIKATYLKVSHHGSVQNIDLHILRAINPKTAIISHGNRSFGRAKDFHPNIKVLEMLQKENVKILLTNDVIKNNVVVMKKANHCQDAFVEIM